MREDLCILLPDLVESRILEYLGYKQRCGKYMKQLPRDLPIYDMLMNRPIVEKRYYSDDEEVFEGNTFQHEYIDENGEDYYFGDEDGCEFYFIVSINKREYKKSRGYFVETVDIMYSASDRNISKAVEEVYEYDYDNSKQKVRR